jgi:hypothetical protein
MIIKHEGKEVRLGDQPEDLQPPQVEKLISGQNRTLSRSLPRRSLRMVLTGNSVQKRVHPSPIRGAFWGSFSLFTYI